jgi:hypothetical protein
MAVEKVIHDAYGAQPFTLQIVDMVKGAVDRALKQFLQNPSGPAPSIPFSGGGDYRFHTAPDPNAVVSNTMPPEIEVQIEDPPIVASPEKWPL